MVEHTTPKNLVMVKNEGVGILENTIKNSALYFELINPVWLPGTHTNSSKIELEFDPNNTNVIIGFFIKTNGSDDSIIDAIKIASRLTNYLSLKTGIFVFHKQPREVVNGKIIIPKVGGFDVILTKLKNLDLTDNSINNLITNDSIENQMMAHFASGQRALDAKIYDQAIREFFLIIEGTNSDDEEKYRSLRNAVSHKNLYPNTISKLNHDFGLSLNVGDHFDITDPNMQGLLKEEAKNLREIAIRYVDPMINV